MHGWRWQRALNAGIAIGAAVAAFGGCGAPDNGDGSAETATETESTTPVVDSQTAAATACPSLTATLAAHAAAGRVQATTLNFIFFQVTTYQTGTPPENLGTDGTKVVTLYKTANDTFTANAANCTDWGVCGNGAVEKGEECEGTLPAGTSCTILGSSFTGGQLKCNPNNCFYDKSACQETAEVCGDGLREGSEDCDGSDFRNGKTQCADIFGNATGGAVKCAKDCRYDSSGCTLKCGNGVIDDDEQCDGSALVPAYAGKTCKDFPFPNKAFPFGNPVNYASGSLKCNGCRVDFSSCQPLAGCYYVTFKTSTTVQCL